MLDYPEATRLQRQLGELPELLIYAELALLPSSAPRAGRVSGATRTAPLPCRADVLSLLGPAAPGAVHDRSGDQAGPQPIPAVIASWARLVAEETHQCLVTGTVGGHLRFLTRRRELAWSVRQPWADEYAAEIDDAWRALQPLAMLRARRRALQLPCPRCGLLSLSQIDGDDVRCGNDACWAVLRADEYERRIEQYLAIHNAA